MSNKHSPPAPNPEPPQQTGHVAVNDRKAARGADYAHDDNPSAESNDAALTTGPAFERRVHADGSVEAPPKRIPKGGEEDDDEDGDGAAADRDATDTDPTSGARR